MHLNEVDYLMIFVGFLVFVLGFFLVSFLFDSVESSKYCKAFFWLTNWYTPA